MRYFVLGANGLLGAYLIDAVKERGMQAIGAARAGADYAVDLRDSELVTRVLDVVAPDVIINAAANTDLGACERDQIECMAVNGFSVASLVAWCERNGARLVQISTDHYYSGDGDMQHDELCSLSILNSYAAGKFVGERAALMHPDSLVIRTNFTGFRRCPGRKTFIEWLATAIQAKGQIVGFHDYFTSTMDVAGLAQACLDLVDLRVSGVINVASREVSNKLDFIFRFAERLNARIDCIPGSVMSLSPKRAESSGLAVSRAEELLGYKLPSLEQVVDRLACEYERRVRDE